MVAWVVFIVTFFVKVLVSLYLVTITADVNDMAFESMVMVAVVVKLMVAESMVMTQKITVVVKFTVSESLVISLSL